MNRRGFLKTAVFFALIHVRCLAASRAGTGYSPTGYMRNFYLRPPGAINEKDFMRSCNNCMICAEVCPVNAVRFFTGDYEGRVRPNTPYIVAAERGCVLCLKCTTACPTGALMPLKKPEDARMGRAYIIEKLCFPYINQGGCGACYTVCPVNAVRLDMQRYPVIIEKKCVGCGLCEEVCLQKVKAVRIGV